MADVFYPNVAVAAANNAFSFVWKVSRAMKKAGWTYIASGDGTSKDTTSVATADLWGGNADPSADTYPTGLDSVSAWWLATGPATVKVPVSSNSTGTFLRGEKVTQATSGAEGEILGFMYDTATVANSFLNILARTGTFNGTDVITGASSGATITATATPTVYTAEVLFWKAANTGSGTIYTSRARAAEASLVDLTGASGCTATVAPGGGGTGNSFPTLAAAILGAGGSATHVIWFGTASIGSPKAQVVATNVTGATGVSPDGTFWLMSGNVAAGAGASSGFGYFRLDDTEEGDLDPFVWQSSGGFSSYSRTSVPSAGYNDKWSNNNSMYVANYGLFFGWRRRGFATGDDSTYYSTAALNYLTGVGSVLLNTFATVETVACHTQTIKVREPVWVAPYSSVLKHRKGTLRWFQYVPTGAAYDLWDTKTWVQVFAATSTYPGIILGPWDGTSTPTQS